MASLSSTTELTRKVLKWVALGIAAILVILVIYRIALFIKAQITPPPPPTVAFGKLPKTPLPESTSRVPFTFSISTLTGALPAFSDRTTVFKTVEDLPQLLALSKASNNLATLTFTNPVAVSQTQYQWSKIDSNSKLPSKITFDIFSGDFNLTSPFLSDSNVLSANNLPNQTAAIDEATSFLSSTGSMPDDLDNNKTQTKLLAIKNGTTTPASSLSSTQIIEVSFFQKDLAGLPIVYPDPYSSTMNVFVSGGPGAPQIVKADFFHQKISSESATYPIITASQAYEKLKNGQAFIVAGGQTQVSIKNVFLAYFLSDQKQPYVMPVVVFVGDNFAAYVPAVTDAWIQK